MGTIGWIMLIAHVCLFFYTKKKLAKKARRLQLENSNLKRDNSQISNQLRYYKTEHQKELTRNLEK